MHGHLDSLLDGKPMATVPRELKYLVLSAFEYFHPDFWLSAMWNKESLDKSM